ncbi:unnamed protein product, partial [Rotaria magnacalcarata]
MLGTKPGKFWIGTWCFAAPAFLGGIIIFGLARYTNPAYGEPTDPFYYK